MRCLSMVPRLKVVNAQGEVIYKGRQLGETKAQTLQVGDQGIKESAGGGAPSLGA